MNINNDVWVKLTAAGAYVWNHRNDELEIPSDLQGLDLEAGALLKIQLWELMQIFGKHIYHGGPTLFDKCEMHLSDPGSPHLEIRVCIPNRGAFEDKQHPFYFTEELAVGSVKDVLVSTGMGVAVRAQEWTIRDGIPHRTITQLELYSLSFEMQI